MPNYLLLARVIVITRTPHVNVAATAALKQQMILEKNIYSQYQSVNRLRPL